MQIASAIAGATLTALLEVILLPRLRERAMDRKFAPGKWVVKEQTIWHELSLPDGGTARAGHLEWRPHRILSHEGAVLTLEGCDPEGVAYYTVRVAASSCKPHTPTEDQVATLMLAALSR
jgi:hypothetical protein